MRRVCMEMFLLCRALRIANDIADGIRDTVSGLLRRSFMSVQCDYVCFIDFKSVIRTSKMNSSQN